jgi:hypothetical protein
VARVLQGDFPYISPEGHTIIDLIFGARPRTAAQRSARLMVTSDAPCPSFCACAEDGLRLAGAPASAAEVCAAIESVPGVLAHGLEAGGRVHAAVVAQPGSNTPRIVLPYLRDATDEQRALARGM